MTTELRELLTKATNVGAWEVVPSNGKPTIHAGPGGNLFRGYIATWNEAALIVAAVNALPALLDRVEALEAENGPPDEDWLADVIDDSLDMEWTGRVGARAIIAAWETRNER